MTPRDDASTSSCRHCGAQSAAVDYCDSCGGSLAGAQAAGPTEEATCPTCSDPRAPGDEFCEGCGRDFAGGAAAAPPSAPPEERSATGDGRASEWTAVVEADRAFFDANRSGVPDTLTFPAGLAAREVALTGDEIVIGRRNEAKGFFPDIDLSTPVTDPAVSRVHAVLSRQGDGSWALLDRGSANGTWVNGAIVPVEAVVATPLHDGDRVHLGAFSVLRMRRNGQATG